MNPFNRDFNAPHRREDVAPGKHLPVFYKDVIDDELIVNEFDVHMKAVTNIDVQQIARLRWRKMAGPHTGVLANTNQLEGVVLRNPAMGGAYKIQLDMDSYNPSEANIVLPLAGAEVSAVVKADIERATVFALKVRDRYNFLQRQLPTNLYRWFWKEGAGEKWTPKTGQRDKCFLGSCRQLGSVLIINTVRCPSVK